MASHTRAMSLRHFVQMGLVVILVLQFVLVMSSWVQANEMRRQLEATAHTLEVQQALKEVERQLLRYESGARGFFYTGDPTYLYQDDTGLTLRDALKGVQEKVAHNSSQLERLAVLERLVRERAVQLQDAIDLKRSAREAELRSVIGLGDGRRKSEEIFAQIEQMYRVESSLLQQGRLKSDETQQVLQLTLLGGLMLAMCTGALLMHTLTRRLAPLDPSVSLAERISAGDLTMAPLQVLTHDEVGRVTLGLNRMLKNLQRLIRRILNSADTLNESTRKIASAARDQAISTQQQFTALQQTSVTMEELTQSAGQVVERTREVNSRHEATAAASRIGQEAVQKSVRATQAIVEQVREVAEHISSLSLKTQAIRDVVLSVNDIAERSNVLALNASILAAGAGPEGKSFAVVANEMKSLADQSKEATVVVRSLLGEVERGIQTSVSLTREATRRASETGSHTDGADQAIRQLGDHVEESVQAFQQIAAATHQQSLAFEQVSEALRSIRQASQQSAHNTQLLEQASQELHRLSGEMVGVISHYRVASEEHETT